MWRSSYHRREPDGGGTITSSEDANDPHHGRRVMSATRRRAAMKLPWLSDEPPSPSEAPRMTEWTPDAIAIRVSALAWVAANSNCCRLAPTGVAAAPATRYSVL